MPIKPTLITLFFISINVFCQKIINVLSEYIFWLTKKLQGIPKVDGWKRYSHVSAQRQGGRQITTWKTTEQMRAQHEPCTARPRCLKDTIAWLRRREENTWEASEIFRWVAYLGMRGYFTWDVWDCHTSTYVSSLSEKRFHFLSLIWFKPWC